MATTLKVAEFDVKDEALEALKRSEVDVAIIRYSKTPYFVLYALKTAESIFDSRVFRTAFKREKDEGDFAIFVSNLRAVINIYAVLMFNFDVDLV